MYKYNKQVISIVIPLVKYQTWQINDFNIPSVQFWPVYPGLHTHVKASIESIHVLFPGQSTSWHSSMSTEQVLPVYPGGQAQAKSVTKSYKQSKWKWMKVIRWPFKSSVLWIIWSSTNNLLPLTIQLFYI